MTVLWNTVDGTGDANQCRSVGQPILSGSYSCAATDVFIPGTTVYVQAKDRTTWAEKYLESYINVNPVVVRYHPLCVCDGACVSRWFENVPGLH